MAKSFGDRLAHVTGGRRYCFVIIRCIHARRVSRGGRRRAAEAGCAALAQAVDVLFVHRQEEAARALPPTTRLSDFFRLRNDVVMGLLQAIVANSIGQRLGHAPVVFSMISLGVPVPSATREAPGPPPAGWIWAGGFFHPSEPIGGAAQAESERLREQEEKQGA